MPVCTRYCILTRRWRSQDAAIHGDNYSDIFLHQNLFFIKVNRRKFFQNLCRMMTVINVTRRPHQIRQDNAPDDDRENNQSSAIAVNDNMDMRQQNLFTPAPDPVQRVRGNCCRYAVTALPVLFFLITASEKFPPLLRNDLFCTIHEISYSSCHSCAYTCFTQRPRPSPCPGPLPPSPALLFR